VYLDGYGTYWSVACVHDWDGTTFYDPGGLNGSPVGYEYISWRASWSWVAVLTRAGLSAPLAEAYTIASEDARRGLAASPSPLLGPPTQQRRQPKVLAGVSESTEIGILRLNSLLTLSAIIIGTPKEASTTTAVQRVGYRCMLRRTSYSLAQTYRVLTTTARRTMPAPPARRTPSSAVLSLLVARTFQVLTKYQVRTSYTRE
jgi:hypothetical protein